MGTILDLFGVAVRDVWDALRDEADGPTRRTLWGAITRAGIRMSTEQIAAYLRQAAAMGAQRRGESRFAGSSTGRHYADERFRQRQQRRKTPPSPPPAGALPTHVRQAYRTLGLSHGATLADATRARRALARRHHPDSGGDNRKMAAINAAYDTAAAWLRSGGLAGM